MATAGFVEGIKSMTECSMCLCTFKQPRSLPCLHTFCQLCLQQYVEKEDMATGGDLPCPICRKVFCIPLEGVSGLPINFNIQNLIDLKEKCGENHKTADPVKALENSMRTCEVHSSELIRAYCWKCDVCICASCMLSDHCKHEYEEVKVAAQRFTQHFNETLTKLDEAVTCGYCTIKDLMTADEQVIKESSEVYQKIKERCDHLRKTLDDLEVELLSEVNKFREKRLEKIKSKIEEKEYQNKLLESLITHLQELNNDYDITYNGRELSTRAEELLKSSNKVLSDELTMIHLEFLTSYEAIEMKLSRELIGEIKISGEKQLVMIGFSTGPSVEQKICHISLDKPDSVKVINSTPAYVSNGSAACVVSNDLYAVGIGLACDELWKWSAIRDEWTRCADLPSGRGRYCVTAVENKIYVLGGWVDADKRTLDDILSYDINSDTWTEAGKLSHAVWGTACVTYKHCVYAFGGVDKDNKLVNYVQIYDTSTGGVSLGSNPMPQALHQMRVVLWRSEALLVGYHTCYVYDLESNTWMERVRFKTNVWHFGLTLDDNTLYVSGGGKPTDDVWTCRDDVMSLSVEDFISDNKDAEWKHLIKLPVPTLIQAYSDKPRIES